MKNKKIVLHSIGNNENFNFYVFDKKQEVFDILNKIFFMDFDVNWSYDKKIHENVDLHESVTDFGDKIRIDIFLGDKKMFLTINCSDKLRLKFNESLFKYIEMPKPIKIKKKKFRKK
jgi:hypothetical protein